MARRITPSFRATWLEMARNGICDRVDSDEYDRVRRKWYEAGKPGLVGDFILEQTKDFRVATVVAAGPCGPLPGTDESMPPGVGKSEAVKEEAEKQGVPFTDLPFSIKDASVNLWELITIVASKYRDLPNREHCQAVR